MNAKQNALSNKNSSGLARTGSWVTGGLLVIAAALAIAFAIGSTPATIQPMLDRASEPSSRAQTVPDAAAQGVAGYIQAHQGNAAESVQVVPDANTQSVLAYLKAHDAGSSAAAQVVPDANTQSVLAYLKAHGAGQASSTQAVPDANTQSVFAYLRAHGVNVP